MNVLKYGTPILAAASITSFMWPMAAARTVGVGVHRVRVVAEARDGQALRRDLIDDLVRLASDRLATSMCEVPA